MKPQIIVIGGLTQDVFLAGPGLVETGGRLQLDLGDKLDCRAGVAVGGNVANVAVSLARAGLEPRLVGRTGNDVAGQSGREKLQASGVNVDQLRLVDGQPSAYSVVLVTTNGSRVILTDHGLDLDPADWRPALAGLSPGDWVYLSSVGDAELLATTIDQAASNGGRVALNPSGPELESPAAWLAVADRLELLIANREEMARLWPGQTPDQLAAAAGQRIPVVVVTDGPRGSVAAAGGQLYRAGLYQPESPVVDRTGAGDAFAGGLLAGLIQNQPLEACLTWAAANSTAVVGQFGAQAGILKLGSEALQRLAIDRRPIGGRGGTD